MVPTRPGPTSAGVLYHVYSASLCLGWMHDSPWKSTESSLFLKTKGQCLISAEAKVNQVDPSDSKNAGTGKDFKSLEYQYSNQNRDKVWTRQGAYTFVQPGFLLVPCLQPQTGHCQWLFSTNILASSTASPLPATLSPTWSPLRGN